MMRVPLKVLILLAAALALAGAALAAPGKAAGSDDKKIEDITRLTAPSVVRVEARNGIRKVATGVVLDKDGFIATTALISPRDEEIRVTAVDGKGRVLAIDLLPVDAIVGVEFEVMDFHASDAPDRLKARLGGLADGVMSDMAANATGHRKTDHLRIVGLAELAVDFAVSVLAPGGFFLAKVLQGGSEGELLARLKRDFAAVRHLKPKASRADSAELYVLATGFRGARD